MKYLRLILLAVFVMFLQPASAQNDSLISPEVQNYIGYGAIITMMLLFLIALLMILRTFKVLTKVIMKSQGYTNQQIAAELKPAKVEAKPKGQVWNKLLSLRPLSEEKDMIMEHEYDGIQELDNPTPGWFMALFYSTIAFAVCYLLIYHVFNLAPLQDEEYKNEVAVADAAQKVYLSKAANRVDERTVKQVSDPAVIGSGQAVFKQSCAACHGENGQGVVGPNLTDEYWLHGNKIGDIFKTVKYGVQSKGMPTWEKQLSPKQISDVANYILSLKDTHPAGAKEPQGTKEEDNKIAVN
jgi:cytochrome c oxidase cbb3-type subunit 3